MEVVIRPFRPDDWDGLFFLDRGCFEPPYRLEVPRLRALVQDPTVVVVVAEGRQGEDAAIVGALLLKHDRSLERLVLISLMVDAGFRRVGLGGRLLGWADRIARAQGLAEVLAPLEAENGAGAEFLAAQGFAQEAGAPPFFSDPAGGHLWRRAVSEEAATRAAAAPNGAAEAAPEAAAAPAPKAASEPETEAAAAAAPEAAPEAGGPGASELQAAVDAPSAEEPVVPAEPEPTGLSELGPVAAGPAPAGNAASAAAPFVPELAAGVAAPTANPSASAPAAPSANPSAPAPAVEPPSSRTGAAAPRPRRAKADTDGSEAPQRKRARSSGRTKGPGKGARKARRPKSG